jgi:hypothetical protein
MATVNDIATALKTLVDGISGMPTSYTRKADVKWGRDALPVCVISFQVETPDEWGVCGAGGSDRGSIGMGYDFTIAIYRKSPGDIGTTLTTNPDILEDLRQAINAGSLSGATTVWAMELRNRPQWEPSDFADGAEVSRFNVHVGSAEARNG